MKYAARAIAIGLSIKARRVSSGHIPARPALCIAHGSIAILQIAEMRTQRVMEVK